MRLKRGIVSFLAIALAGPAPVPAAESLPDPLLLLERAWQSPVNSFRGRVTIKDWTGKERQDQEANVYYRPSGDYRVELLKPEGSVDRVLFYNAAKPTADPGAVRFLEPRQEKALLLVNYKVSLVGSDKILSRPVWIVELIPSLSGKPSERLAIDRETHLVLESRREVDGRPTGTGFVFTRFHPGAPVPAALFPETEKRDSRQDGPSPASGNLTSEFGSTAGSYVSLPGGYTLQSLAVFEVGGQTVRHLRYTDGLQLVSLFQTRAPVRVQDGSLLPRDVRITPAGLGFGGTESVQHWKKGRRFFTLVGNVPDDLVRQIRTRLP